MCKYFSIRSDDDRFERQCTFSINGLQCKLSFIIDTGCELTFVSTSSLFEEGKYNMVSKMRAIDSYRSGLCDICSIRGIETIGDTDDYRDIHELSNKELIRDESVCFIYKVHDFIIGNYNIGDTDVAVSYDRDDLALLGLRTLNKLDIHMRNGLLIGSLLSDVGDIEYRNLLRREFGLEPCGRQYASFIREEIK